MGERAEPTARGACSDPGSLAMGKKPMPPRERRDRQRGSETATSRLVRETSHLAREEQSDEAKRG